MLAVTIGVILAMIVMNGVFAGYEIALATISTGRLDLLARDGRRGAAAALRMKNNIEASLAVVQVGITLAGMLAAAVGGAGAADSIEPYLTRLGLGPVATQILTLAIVVAPLTAVTIVFGELVPKVFSLRNPERVVLLLSPAMEWFALAVWPAVWLFENSTSWIMSIWRRGGERDTASAESTLQELRAAAALARTRRLIGTREENIIVGASSLADTPVREAMLPVEHISLLNLDDRLDVSLIKAHNDMHTRFPVTSSPGDPQGIQGYVNFKDIVACLRMSPERPNLRGVLRPLPSFDPETSLSHCLESLIQMHTHIALIRDEDDKVLGLVTLEDVLEEVVGDIRDEFDRLPSYVTASGAAWVVGGGTTLETLKHATRISLARGEAEDEGATPLHAWMEQRLGRRVQGGDVIRERGTRILARKARRGMLLEALVGPIGATDVSLAMSRSGERPG
jgi:putative hemolysin